MRWNRHRFPQGPVYLSCRARSGEIVFARGQSRECAKPRVPEPAAAVSNNLPIDCRGASSSGDHRHSGATWQGCRTVASGRTLGAAGDPIQTRYFYHPPIIRCSDRCLDRCWTQRPRHRDRPDVLGCQAGKDQVHRARGADRRGSAARYPMRSFPSDRPSRPALRCWALDETCRARCRISMNAARD